MSKFRIILILCFFIFALSCKRKVDKQRILDKQDLSTQLIIENLITNIKLNNNISLSRSMVLIDAEDSKKSISDLFQNDNRLLFLFFPKNSCGLCLDMEIERLKKLPIKYANKIIVLLTTNNINEVKIYKRRYSVNFRFFDIGDFSLSKKLENITFPYYFVAERDLTTSMFYVPDKNINITTTAYLKEVLTSISSSE